MENRNLESLETQVRNFLDRISRIKQKLVLKEERESGEGSVAVWQEPSN